MKKNAKKHEFVFLRVYKYKVMPHNKNMMSKGVNMYIKDDEYEQIAFVVVKGFTDGVETVIESGNIPAKFDMDYAIDEYLPEKYLDKNNTADNYWTKHNEKKLRKYIKTEITRRKLIYLLNIDHVKNIVAKTRMNTCIETLIMI